MLAVSIDVCHDFCVVDIRCAFRLLILFPYTICFTGTREILMEFNVFVVFFGIFRFGFQPPIIFLEGAFILGSLNFLSSFNITVSTNNLATSLNMKPDVVVLCSDGALS